jgi:hypothetical protein
VIDKDMVEIGKVLLGSQTYFADNLPSEKKLSKLALFPLVELWIDGFFIGFFHVCSGKKLLLSFVGKLAV